MQDFKLKNDPCNEKREAEKSYINKLLTISILQNKKNRKKEKAQKSFPPQLVLSAEFLADSLRSSQQAALYVSLYRLSVTERLSMTSTEHCESIVAGLSLPGRKMQSCINSSGILILK